MSHPKIRPLLVTIGVLLFATLGGGLVVGIRDESVNVHSAAPYHVPALAAPRRGASTKTPTGGNNHGPHNRNSEIEDDRRRTPTL